MGSLKMPGLLRQFLFLALFAVPLLLAGGAVGAEPPVPSVRIVQNHPTLFGQLAGGEAVFVRLAYTSEMPLRFRIEGYAEGQRVAESQSNPAPIYPAGEGEALAWMAYQPPAAIDELKVIILDIRRQPLAVKVARVRLRWEKEASAAGPKQPDWLTRLNSEQQALAALPEPMLDDVPEDLIPREWVLPLAWALVLAYLVLQVPMAIWFTGRWRWAARGPLIATVPLFLYTIGALSAGSNLWPLALLFLTPFVLVYLVVLLAVRLLVLRAAA